MGKGVLYNVVFLISLSIAIFTIVIPAYAQIDTLKFDQSKIPIGHSDVITIIGTTSNSDVTITASSGASIDVTLPQRDANLFWQLVEFGSVTNPATFQLAVSVGDTVTVTDAESNTSTAQIISSADGTLITDKKKLDNNPEDCNNPGLGGDVDEDGVCDSWESGSTMVINSPSGGSYTLDCDSFIQDPSVSPAPACFGTDMRDIYVEIDYMVGHRPNEESLYKVIESFANAPASAPGKPPGIRLHIQLDSNSEIGEIPHNTCIKYPGLNFGIHRGFDQIKAVYFGTDDEHDQTGWGWKQKKQIFHYALFVHNQCGTSGSGVAEVFGNDMMITLGSFSGGLGNPDEQAGTFMHELGHNLNLNHGGAWNDYSNCKPNHLSVMNYARQFPELVPDRPLDYSRQVVGTPASSNSLMENDLDEPNGVDEYRHNGIIETITFGPIPPLIPPLSGGNINWNQNADDDEMGVGPINVNDIPGVGCTGSNNQDTLVGSNDWHEDTLNLNSRGSGNWADGRTLGAGMRAAVWEEGKSDFPLVLSEFCPSPKQILDKIPNEDRVKAENPSAPGHQAALEKMQEHFKNYRVCEGGVGESDTTILFKAYADGFVNSIDDLAAYYIQYPDKYLEHKDAFVDIHNFSEMDEKQQGIDKLKTIHAELKSLISDPKSEEMNEESSKKENIFEIEPIYSKQDATSDAVKSMRLLRIDSLLLYLNSLDKSDFKNSNDSVIKTYYEPNLNEIKDFIKQDKMAEAALKMADITYADKIQTADKIHDLESASQSIIEQYSRAIPEFGTIATLILIAAITSIIILTTKTRNSLISK